MGKVPGKTGKVTPGKKGEATVVLTLGVALGLATAGRVTGTTVLGLDKEGDDCATVLGVAMQPHPEPQIENKIRFRIGEFLIDKVDEVGRKLTHHSMTGVSTICSRKKI
jgi:hypothetical protein